MSLYQHTLSAVQDYGSIEVRATAQATAQATSHSPPNNVPLKIIFIISRDLTEEEITCLHNHGKVEFYTIKTLAESLLGIPPSPSSTWKYMIFDIRNQNDRQWLINNIAFINEYVVIITSDSPDEPWLKKLIDENCVTNILKRLPIIEEKESFDRRIINSLWIPKRKCCWLCC